MKKEKLEKSEESTEREPSRLEMIENFQRKYEQKGFADVPVKDLRHIVPLFLMAVYSHIYGHYSRKVRGLWEKAPTDWPSDLPFVDPNNKLKNNTGNGKPKKETCVQMLIYLNDRLKEQQRQNGNSAVDVLANPSYDPETFLDYNPPGLSVFSGQQETGAWASSSTGARWEAGVAGLSFADADHGVIDDLKFPWFSSGGVTGEEEEENDASLLKEAQSMLKLLGDELISDESASKGLLTGATVNDAADFSGGLDPGLDWTTFINHGVNLRDGGGLDNPSHAADTPLKVGEQSSSVTAAFASLCTDDGQTGQSALCYSAWQQGGSVTGEQLGSPENIDCSESNGTVTPWLGSSGAGWMGNQLEMDSGFSGVDEKYGVTLMKPQQPTEEGSAVVCLMADGGTATPGNALGVAQQVYKVDEETVSRFQQVEDGMVARSFTLQLLKACAEQCTDGGRQVATPMRSDLIGGAMMATDQTKAVIGGAIMTSNPTKALIGGAMTATNQTKAVIGGAMMATNQTKALIGEAMTASNQTKAVIGVASQVMDLDDDGEFNPLADIAKRCFGKLNRIKRRTALGEEHTTLLSQAYEGLRKRVAELNEADVDGKHALLKRAHDLEIVFDCAWELKGIDGDQLCKLQTLWTDYDNPAAQTAQITSTEPVQRTTPTDPTDKLPRYSTDEAWMSGLVDKALPLPARLIESKSAQKPVPDACAVVNETAKVTALISDPKELNIRSRQGATTSVPLTTSVVQLRPVSCPDRGVDAMDLEKDGAAEKVEKMDWMGDELMYENILGSKGADLLDDNAVIQLIQAIKWGGRLEDGRQKQASQELESDAAEKQQHVKNMALMQINQLGLNRQSQTSSFGSAALTQDASVNAQCEASDAGFAKQQYQHQPSTPTGYSVSVSNDCDQETLHSCETAQAAVLPGSYSVERGGNAGEYGGMENLTSSNQSDNDAKSSMDVSNRELLSRWFALNVKSPSADCAELLANINIGPDASTLGCPPVLLTAETSAPHADGRKEPVRNQMTAGSGSAYAENKMAANDRKPTSTVKKMAENKMAVTENKMSIAERMAATLNQMELANNKMSAAQKQFAAGQNIFITIPHPAPAQNKMASNQNKIMQDLFSRPLYSSVSPAPSQGPSPPPSKYALSESQSSRILPSTIISESVDGGMKRWRRPSTGGKPVGGKLVGGKPVGVDRGVSMVETGRARPGVGDKRRHDVNKGSGQAESMPSPFSSSTGAPIPLFVFNANLDDPHFPKSNRKKYKK